jgi:hypothetical protein
MAVMTQMNYLNKALDLFNTAIVSPVYYVMFTLLTIIASIIMFRVRSWRGCRAGEEGLGCVHAEPAAHPEGSARPRLAELTRAAISPAC